jgi:hypothetical protein
VTVLVRMAAVGVLTMTFFSALLLSGATSAAVAVYLVGVTWRRRCARFGGSWC